MNNSSKIKGDSGEAFAADYFLRKGFTVRERGYHSRYGEIDIILEDNEYIIFVEVKTRKSRTISQGIEAVDKNKRIKIIKTALIYLINNPSKKQPRFDVAEITVNNNGTFKNINHFENAFDAEEYNAIF